MSGKPRIVILGTGGTIAGAAESATSASYTSGQFAIDELIAAIPEVLDIAEISGEQVASIGSQDMNDDIWLLLAKRCNVLLAQNDVDGIVITHGTDTMEETAFFLHLTINSTKPVVLTGAMRPATARSADGPLNLYEAVITAAEPESHGRGVMVVANDTVFGARDVTKACTTAIHTFQAPNFGPLGHVHNGVVEYQRSPQRKHTTESEFNIDRVKALPRVGIVYSHANCSDVPVRAFIDAGFDGLVHAGFGNGNFCKDVGQALIDAVTSGMAVVRSSRAWSGATTLVGEVDDDKLGFVASGLLNPQKARILLQLALLKTNERSQIREYFLQY